MLQVRFNQIDSNVNIAKYLSFLDALKIFSFFSKFRAMGRKFVVGGNWKMNGTKQEIDKILEFLKQGPLNPDTEVIVGVPSIYLDYVAQRIPPNVQVAAQNCYKVPKGAFTGRCLQYPNCNVLLRYPTRPIK